MIEAAYQNKTVTAIDSVVNVRKIPAFSGELISGYKSGVVIGRSSGNTLMMGTDKWIQVNLTTPVNGVAMGYVVETYKGRENVKLTEPGASPVAEKNAQPLLDTIVANDKKTYAQLLDVYNGLMILKKQGISVPIDIADRLVTTYTSLANRSRKLRNMPEIKCTTGSAKDKEVATQLQNYVSDKRQGGGVMGFDDAVGDFGVTLLVIIIIAVIAAAAGGAAVYYSIKPDYDDSKVDLKESDLLKKALGTLTPAEQKTVRDDLNKQQDDAYNKGKFNQSFKDFFSGIGGKIVIGAIVFGGTLLLFKGKKGK